MTNEERDKLAQSISNLDQCVEEMADWAKRKPHELAHISDTLAREYIENPAVRLTMIRLAVVMNAINKQSPE